MRVCAVNATKLASRASLSPRAMCSLSVTRVMIDRQIRKGAVDAVAAHAGGMPANVREAAGKIGDTGGTPLAVSDGTRVLGIIHLKDIVKQGIRERFVRFRAMGIRTVMITGDNPRTAKAIAVAVRVLSPVIMMVLMPILRSWANRSLMPPLTTSFR